MEKQLQKRLAKKPQHLFFKRGGTLLGRGVPIVGWALLGKDVWDVWAPAAKAGIESYNNAYPVDKPGNLIYHICFVKGTLVYGKDNLVAIDEIKVGDSVYSYNLDLGKVELSKVVNKLQRQTYGIYELGVRKEKIYVTEEHPFYVIGKGWVNVKELKVGDKLKTSTGNSIKVKSLKSLNRDVVVYNIEVDGNHNYFVTGSSILVHNKKIIEQKEPQQVDQKNIISNE